MSAKPATTPAPVASAPVKVATYPETAQFRVLKANPKRGASAARYALYGPVGTVFTLGAYLDACLVLQPEEPRYRWRADIAWDINPKRGFIEYVAPKAE